MSMRALVTGATGFVGLHLLRELAAAGADAIIGLSRDPPVPDASLPADVSLHQGDLLDAALLARVLADARPTHLFHLAGYADTGRSFQEPEAVWRGNLDATRSLYEAVHRAGLPTRILFVSSGTVYGEPDTSQPVDETAVLRPQSPYAASKAAADLLSYQVSCAPGLDIVRARPFNHVGPGQSARYAVANFARQLAAIERGLQPPLLRVGNLSPLRDFTDVRDVVRAYVLLGEKGRKGEAYNVASGNSLPMSEVLRQLLSLCRIPVRVETDPLLVRAVEWAGVRVDVRALQTQTGWRPALPLRQTLEDTLDYWRGRADELLLISR
jgi:GDP-4-dehydro-6-deoxy-D-mannose reductase